jgi:hypothetical protein
VRGGIVLAIILSATQPAHVSNTFHLVVPAPLSRAAGPHWNPEFVYPQPGQDVQGAVFTVQHGPHRAIWVNTVFDTAAGRMQYVSFIPDTLVFTVDVRLSAVDPAHTSVEVTYARTALDAAVNDEVEIMGTRDRESGPEWQEAIEKCLHQGR